MLSVEFGALVPPISEQLVKSGYEFDEVVIARMQYLADSLVRLGVAGILSESQVNEARRKLTKKIAEAIEVWGGDEDRTEGER